ncbi:autotransporter outer membrane beta-barrel domain-containing protein [Mesorhizobium sp. B2-4-6]|uniref:autotransporter outer membrane beta-barrel domain-containing protein n=1 Tax=Mesorhizobium sp. B2-4-6 TaxID=2589943 RepID=UPI00112BDB9C|nr:autotransporter outer membrane beta-barrel domain-containing protein [Mesorhizobium sp. B2-4-6]TPL36025.1 autotransporter outer membrane beta-barrel domain-containing protein [Mesorhizobium sp. B2-4-6]
MDVRRGNSQDPTDPNALGYAEQARPDDPIRAAFGYVPGDAGKPGLADKRPLPQNGSPSNLAFWAGGFVNFGTSNKSNVDVGHTLVGVSGGMDYRFSPSFTAGIGYGRDTVDVGADGTQSNGQAFSAALCGSYHPRSNVFVDGLLGYSALDFASTRFVTPTNGFATGDRSGSQVFGSLSSGYEHKGSNFLILISPYGRIEAVWTQLNAFTESVGAPYDLTFGDQTIDMLAGILGLRAEYTIPQDWGLLKTRGRLEYTHDFSGSSLASMGYADLRAGLPYSLNIDAFTSDYIAVGLGFDASVGSGTTLGFDYTTALGFEGKSQAHNFALRLSEKF